MNQNRHTNERGSHILEESRVKTWRRGKGTLLLNFFLKKKKQVIKNYEPK